MNPRGSYKPPTRLAGERLRPLGHLSFGPASDNRFSRRWRREWDLNPRGGGHPQRHFQCRALDQTMRSLHTRNVDRLRKRSVRPRTLASGSREVNGEMTESTDHNRFMEMALAEAAKAPAHGDVPVGAVVVDSTGRVVASDHNRRGGAGGSHRPCGGPGAGRGGSPGGLLAAAGAHPLRDPGAVLDVRRRGGVRAD